MIPVRLLRAFANKPAFVPTGIRIIRRTQATLAETLSTSSIRAPPNPEPPNQVGTKKKKKREKEISIVEKNGGAELDLSPSRRVVKLSESGLGAKTKVKSAKKLDTLGGTKKRKNKGSKDELDVAEAVREPPPTTKAIILRDYQQECIDAVLDHVKQGRKRLAISLATGSGKTVIFTQLIDKLPAPNDTATQTLILVHRRELLEQALRHCMNAYPEKTVEVEMANRHASGVADITLASIQSIVSKDRVEKFNPQNFKLILIDECHHAVADTYMRTLDHFGALHPEKSGGNHPVVVGVSATLSRHDGLKMGTVLDYIVYHKNYIDMISENWLSNVQFTTVQTHVDLSAVRESRGDYNLADLSLAVNTSQTNNITARAWLEKAGKRKSTLVFCVDIAHVTEMTNTFRKYGVDARFVTSHTPKEDRTRLLDDFRAGIFPVLVNCGILTEGTDIPNIDCVLLARPTRSKNLLIQMIGRGMRLSPGKESCHVIDMIGILNRGIISTPTLFGLDPFTILDNATPSSMEKMRDDAKEGLEILQADSSGHDRLWDVPIKHVSFTDYENIWDLLKDSGHEKQIRQLSPYSWVKVGLTDYVLSAAGMVLKISKRADGKYTILQKQSPQWNFFAEQYISQPEKILADNIDSLAHAVRGADTYASEHYPRKMILHSAPWRKAPASSVQLNHLKKMKPEGDWDQKKLTKGQAGDILTRRKFGMAKFERALKQAKKAKETEAKRLEAKQSNEIKVGRLI